MNYFQIIPNELVVYTETFFDFNTLLAFGHVCKRFRLLNDEPTLKKIWEEKQKECFPFITITKGREGFFNAFQEHTYKIKTDFDYRINYLVLDCAPLLKKLSIEIEQDKLGRLINQCIVIQTEIGIALSQKPKESQKLLLQAQKAKNISTELLNCLSKKINHQASLNNLHSPKHGEIAHKLNYLKKKELLA